MADAAASVCAVGTLTHPAIAIATPSTSTHHRDPLIALSSPTRVLKFQGHPDRRWDGRALPRDSALEKEMRLPSAITGPAVLWPPPLRGPAGTRTSSAAP